MRRRRILVVAVLLIALATGLLVLLWRPSAPQGRQTEGESGAPATTQREHPAGWDTLKNAQLPSPRGTLTIQGTVIGPLGAVAGAAVVATEADGDEVLSARMCQCDDHCGNKLLECNCAEAARQLHELVAARIGEAQPLARATADAQGNFLLEGLKAGTYALWATSDDQSGVLPDVVAGASSLEVEIAPGVKLEGRVTDESGQPVAGAWVTGIFTQSSRFFDATSDATGHFKLSGLPHGQFRFVADHQGLLPASTSLQAEGAKQVELELKFPRSLSGHVMASERPAPGAKVELFGEHRKATAVADSQGAYSVTGLRPGDYVVRAEGAGGIARATVTLDARESRLDLQLGPTAHLQGRVSDETGAPAVAEVIATADGQDVARVTSASDGSFQLGELPPGKYSLVARLERHPGPETVVELAPGAEHSIELKVFRGATVTGQVVDLNGAPVGNATVSFDAAKAKSSSAKSDSDGGFRVGGVEPGHRKWTVEQTDFMEASGELDVPSAPLTVRLEPGASISGEFTDEDNRPVVGDVGARRGDDSNEKVKWVKSDVQGKYELKGLASGHYQVWGWGPKRERTTQSEVDVADHESAKLDLNLEAGVAISGTVVDEAGDSAPGVKVVAFSQRSETDIDAVGHRETVSSPDGGFLLAHLTAGNSYRVLVGDEGRLFFGKKRILTAPATDVRLVVPSRPHLRGRVVRTDGSVILDFSVDGAEKHTRDGRFDVVEQQEGEETIEFAAPGFAPTQKKVSLPKSGLDVGDIVLVPGRTVMVTVLGTNDSPVSGATIARAQEGGFDFPEEMFDFPGRTRHGPKRLMTDASGKARFENAPVEDFSLKVSHPQFVATRTTVASGNTEVTVRLAPAGEIRGVVRGVDGGPLEASVVAASRDGGEQRMMGFSRSGGSFSISGVASGAWTLIAEGEGRRSAPATINVKENEVATVELAIRSGGLHVAFRIQPQPDSDSMVELIAGDFDVATANDGRSASDTFGLSQNGGVWTGEGVVPGAYTLVVVGQQDDGRVSARTAKVVISGQQSAPQDVLLGAPKGLDSK